MGTFMIAKCLSYSYVNTVNMFWRLRIELTDGVKQMQLMYTYFVLRYLISHSFCRFGIRACYDMPLLSGICWYDPYAGYLGWVALEKLEQKFAPGIIHNRWQIWCEERARGMTFFSFLMLLFVSHCRFLLILAKFDFIE